MNRHSFPREIDAADLNARRLHVFDGCDDSTTRQLLHLSRTYQQLNDLPSVLMTEGSEYPDTEHLYTLTTASMEQYISHGVIYLGQHGINLCRFNNCDDEDWDAFCNVVGVSRDAGYPEAS